MPSRGEAPAATREVPVVVPQHSEELEKARAEVAQLKAANAALRKLLDGTRAAITEEESLRGLLQNSEQAVVDAKETIAELEAKLAQERGKNSAHVEEARRQQCTFDAKLEEERDHAALLRSKLDDLTTRTGKRSSLVSQLFGRGCVSSGDAESRAMRNGVRADVLQGEVRRLSLELGKRAMQQEQAEQDAKVQAALAEKAAEALQKAEVRMEELESKEHKAARICDGMQGESERFKLEVSRLSSQLRGAEQRFKETERQLAEAKKQRREEQAQHERRQEALQMALQQEKAKWRTRSPPRSRRSQGHSTDILCSRDSVSRTPAADDAVGNFGEVLLQSIAAAPEEERAKMRKQLLLCFHPDRNPVSEVATRLTQVLMSEQAINPDSFV